jgi:hypothetical protein
MLGILKKTSFLMAVTYFSWTVSKVNKNLHFWTKCSQLKKIIQQKCKNEQYCADRLFIFKVAETFC